MGIPHLITFLQSYATLESLTEGNAVVDGPGLAYHVYYLCLSQRPSARNAFEAAPSYKELGDAAIEWLEGLRKSGVVVQKIYFDGYLPPSKLDVRLERLRVQTKRMNDYCNANQIPCRLPIPPIESTPHHMFAREGIRSNLTTLPPLPFLVPAVIQALSSSERYTSVVKVVPGEADLYCAEYLKLHGGVIFTGDSDLLIHDLSDEGSVVFFKDLEASPGSEVLRSPVYHPAAIANNLALPKAYGLRSIAFELVKDSQVTFRKLLAQATALKAIKTFAGEYADFSKDYISLAPDSEAGERTKFVQALQKLDPRISEYVIQFPSLAKCAGQKSPNEFDSPHVFLPFLLDCPVKTTAWETSTSLRQLAYGLLKLIVLKAEQSFSVFEHRRQQSMSSKGLQLSSTTDIPKECEALLNIIDQIDLLFPTLSIPDRWIALVTYQEIKWSTALERPVLSDLFSEQLGKLEATTQPPRKCTWDTIQFLAQVQGTFYSLRMLQQIASLVILHPRSNAFPNEVAELHRRLVSIPQIDEVPDLRSAISLAYKIRIKGMVKVAYEMLGIEAEGSIDAQAPSKGATKKRKRNKKQGLAPDVAGKSKNPFALLASE